MRMNIEKEVRHAKRGRNPRTYERVLVSSHGGKVVAIEGAREVYGELACLHGSVRGHYCAACAKER